MIMFKNQKKVDKIKQKIKSRKGIP